MHYIYENEENILVQIELAGVNPTDIDVTLEKNEIHIQAKRSTPKGKLLIAETEGKMLHKIFQLSPQIDTENMEAIIKEGILSLKFAKKNKRTSIQVQAA